MKKFNCILITTFLFLSIAASCQKPKEEKEVTLLQMNLWHEGREVEGGFEAIISEIERINPDIALFCEIRNPNGRIFIPTVIEALEARGLKYYGENDSTLNVGIISKYEIKEQAPIFYKDQKTPILKAKIQLDSTKVATIYSAHLDYRNYACFLPRGYSGSTWKKIEAPVINEDSVLMVNRLSFREEAIKGVVEDVRNHENSENGIIILGGDFNEPSHLDWQEDTKNMYDHNGAVINWDCSTLLAELGFRDSFREKYPNPVTHPGFTFPADNVGVEISKLAWAPDVDERDRIDFIHYIPNKRISLKDIIIVGPEGTIVKGERATKDSEDIFDVPNGIWPTDHKVLFATFIIK